MWAAQLFVVETLPRLIVHAANCVAVRQHGVAVGVFGDFDYVRFAEAAEFIAAREPGHEYHVEHHGERLIITTNSGGAEDFRICEAPLAAPGMENWREIVPHKPGRLIIDTIAFKVASGDLSPRQGAARASSSR